MNRITFVLFFAIVGCAFALPRARSNARSSRPIHSAPLYAAPAHTAPVYSAEENYPPQPHSFSYDETDEEGNQRFHSETGDGSGKVTGTYGYKDAYGVYRVVDYVADENGYRATIRSNEPGMEAPGPADVELNVETPPANVFLGHQLYPSSSELKPSYVPARRT